MHLMQNADNQFLQSSCFLAVLLIRLVAYNPPPRMVNMQDGLLLTLL